MPLARRYCQLIPALFLTVLCIALVAGCSNQEPEQVQGVQLQAEVTELETQVSDLEEEIQALRQDVANLAMRHEQDIEALRSDLKNVLEYLNIALDRLAGNKDLGQELEDAKDSAARALRDSLQQLLDMSKEMIERLEKEIEGSDTKNSREKP